MQNRKLRLIYLLPLTIVVLSSQISAKDFAQSGNRQVRLPAKYTIAQHGVFAGPILKLNGSRRRYTYLCAHSIIQLNGSVNTLTLKGTCNSIEVTGSENTLIFTGTCEKISVTGSCDNLRIIGAVASINITGADNVVTWTKQTSQRTAINITGANNSCDYKP